MNTYAKTVSVDSRDDKAYYALGGIGSPGKPQYKIKCPHCGTLQLLTLEKPIHILGLQSSPVVTCNQELVEEPLGHNVTKGCKKRFVVDIRVDVLATCIPLVENI